MATGPATLTVSGTPLTLLPVLSTAYPQPPSCALTYRQLEGQLLARDVVYGLSFAAEARTCFPPEVTSWWFQSEATSTLTAFGPSFQCPEAYEAVQTAVISESAREVFCCPSSYSLLVPQPFTNAFPSQCFSTATSGQVLSFLDLTAPDGTISGKTTTSTVDEDKITIYGQPVNGFNLEVATSTATDSARRDVPTPTESGANTTSSSNEGSKGTTSLAVNVGVSVGVVIGLALISLGTWILWRRRRRVAKEKTTPDGGYHSQSGGHADLQSPHQSAKWPYGLRGPIGQELPGDMQSRDVYELPNA